jgi:hypothetical protein
MKSKPQPVQQEVRAVLTEREVLRLLATDRETLAELLRRKVIRAWAYLEPREDFFPLQYATTVAVIESRPETKLHYAEFVLTRIERAVYDDGERVNLSGFQIDRSSLRFDQQEIDSLTGDLEFTPGFTRIVFKGKEHSLTKTQAKIMRLLWQSYIRGEAELSEDEIYDALDLEISDRRMENSFKGSKLLGTLINQTRKRARAYRLNLNGIPIVKRT